MFTCQEVTAGVAASWRAAWLRTVRFAFPLRWQQALAVCGEGRKSAGSLPERAHLSGVAGEGSLDFPASWQALLRGIADAEQVRGFFWFSGGFVTFKVKKPRSPLRFVHVGELSVGRKLLWFVSGTMTGADLTCF